MKENVREVSEKCEKGLLSCNHTYLVKKQSLVLIYKVPQKYLLVTCTLCWGVLENHAPRLSTEETITWPLIVN